MNDSRLLYDAFNIYYERGMSALQENRLDIARRNILAAAETLLKLARESSGELRAKRIKRAEELGDLASKIEGKQKVIEPIPKDTNMKTPEFAPVVVKEAPKITLEEALESLMSLEGLNEVKEQVSDLADQIKVFQMRKAQNLPAPEMTYHMVFTGNPGTGKTTVARILGQIFHALGILSKGHFVETDRSKLVAGYVGQTALKTQEVLNQAMGGILFIDEAYALKKDGNDFGQEAIDTLNKVMEDSRADLVVIVAGYKDEMKDFIEANPGLRSRFRTYIDFKDYTGKELFNIFLAILAKNRYQIEEDAGDEVMAFLSNPGRNRFTGNARDVRNLFENIVKFQSRRVARLVQPTSSEITTITMADLPFPPQEKAMDDKPTRLIKTVKEVHPDDKKMPEAAFLDGNAIGECRFDWDSLPSIGFGDIAGLDGVKELVKTKVLLPLQHPEAFEGYEKKNGGGLLLYGPPGTGKTMIGAAIANEIGAKFCSVKPSDLLQTGVGNTEKAVRALFAEARRFPCAILYFDEMDAIAMKNTKSTFARQLRSELLAQMQGIESYGKETGNLLFLIASTNKPWDIDNAFLRPGRFGTKVYVGLPDSVARESLISTRFQKIADKGLVSIDPGVDIASIIERTAGFNGSDITSLLDRMEEISACRGVRTGVKAIIPEDIDAAFLDIASSVQGEDIEKLLAWKDQNNG